MTREEAITELNTFKIGAKSELGKTALNMAMQSLSQEPKTGHWILDETDNSITCDKCGCLIWANDISNGEAYYCPNCGCRMVEPQESEEQTE